ncbi:MAG: helix-turn-helix transcriptional regulator [Halioglobus sp.]
MANNKDIPGSDSLLDSLVKLTGQVAGGTLEMARNTATMTAMFGDNWLRTALLKTMEPERLEAMADAGHFLRDARETAGLSLKDLAENLGIADNEVLKDVESGDTIMPLELMLRCASLLARHDPIPFLIKFMRTYNPSLGQTLEQWGVMTLPKNYERERRFVNLYRQHDTLRSLSDEEYLRFNEYMDSSISLVLDVMVAEKAASNTDSNAAKATSSIKKGSAKKPRKTAPRAGTTAKPKSKTRTRPAGSAGKD